MSGRKGAHHVWVPRMSNARVLGLPRDQVFTCDRCGMQAQQIERPAELHTDGLSPKPTRALLWRWSMPTKRTVLENALDLDVSAWAVAWATPLCTESAS